MVDWSEVLSIMLAQAPLVAVAILVIIVYVERRLLDMHIFIDQKFTALMSYFDKRLAEVTTYFEQRLSSLERQFEQRFNSLEQRYNSLEQRFNGLEQRYNGLEQRLFNLEQRLSSLDQRVARLELRLSNIERSFGILVSFNESLLSILYSRRILSSEESATLKALLAQVRPLAESRYYTKEVAEKLDRILAKELDELTWDDVFELERIFQALVDEAAISDEKRARELIWYAGKLKVYKALVMGHLMSKGIMPPPPSRRAGEKRET